MIRMIQSKSAGHAKDYFLSALSRADYYTNDQELPGRWQGRLAERLGLAGNIEKDDFFALCDNLVPKTEQPLTPRTKQERTAGYDINFHCPKSVSVMHVLSGNKMILTAFEKSVEATMKLIEADCKTRVRKNDKSEDRPTGDMVWGQFVHQTARPVKEMVPDPHLHAHCFVFNATWDETEQKMKAAQFRDINRDMPYYQAHFQKELADRLVQQGFPIRKTEKSFEMDQVPKEVIDLFSKRTDQIGRIAKEKGITDAKEKSKLGALTRGKKQKGMSMEDLQELWQEQIDGLTLKEKFKGEKPLDISPPDLSSSLTAQQSIDHAVLHYFERCSVVSDRELLQEAMRFSLGDTAVTFQEIDYRLKNDSRILKIEERGRTMCTTREVLREEKRMVDLAQMGKGQMIPLYAEKPQIALVGQQAAAVEHVLTTPDRISIIRGAAGTGKTTLMKQAVQKIEEAGKRVTVIAPTAKASRGNLKEAGFQEADTVSKFLTDAAMVASLKGQVLWVDEAGLLGTKQMLKLIEITTAQDARLIFGGDTRQHASVVRGDALRILNTVAGINAAEVNKIYRQEREDYRSAVEDLAKGDVETAFKKLDDIGFINTMTPERPNGQLIDDYITAVKQGKSTLVIAPTHAQGEILTIDIRERLKAEGKLGKKETAVTQYKNAGLTEAEKKDSRNFEEGNIIVFNQNAKGFKRSSTWTVEKIADKNITIINDNGERKLLPTDQSTRYDVYQKSDIALAKKDRIRITKNSFDLDGRRLNNGDEFIIKSVSAKGAITLYNEKAHTSHQINIDLGHIAYAYCSTSHSAQGATVKAVFISQPMSTFPATDAKQFYVSVSRGKEYAYIYTDDKEALLEHAKDLRERPSAMELVEDKDLAWDLQRKMDVQKAPVKNHKPLNSKFVIDHAPEI